MEVKFYAVYCTTAVNRFQEPTDDFSQGISVGSSFILVEALGNLRFNIVNEICQCK